ncbi:signal peptidase I [Paenibacillus sp. LBL]|uniref:signal peptidase I n=1 Tax=Paenibacillus sp. LBL TaxID=2940563 RepID=UPI00247408EB|nr:signal peptidase I [Paenibacillus sp. LBL]MDH6671250.1 signal peptidase I [Paenibacillus sp. LBL]
MRRTWILGLILIFLMSGCSTDKTSTESINDSEKPKVLKIIDYRLDNMSRQRTEYHYAEDGSLVIDSEIDHTTMKPGDIVYFIPPEFEGFKDNPNFKLADHYISRLIASEGDSVEIKEGVVYVNDKKLDGFYGAAAKYGLTEQEYIDKQKEIDPNFKLTEEDHDFFKQNMGKVEIPKEYIFVLGDHWGRSVDSRHFGPVPFKNIQGKVLGVTKEF